MPNSAGKNASYSKRTGQYVKKGHTAGKYGNDPSVASVNKKPRELNF